jgi:hypothetical protein
MTPPTAANLEEIKQLAREQLMRFVRHIGDPEVFRPEPEDYARVFVPDAAERARAAYQVVWLTAPRPQPNQGQSEVLVFGAPAGLLTDDNELSRRFPNGYRSIAHLLDRHQIWLAWKYVVPGASSGMSYDGLVWLDGRFAWFPKPWRVLGDRGEN